jgi:mannosyl-3-phosphoglycerate phosphatase
MTPHLHKLDAMPHSTSPLIIFTDLDGCLLNKHDYDWSAAATTLEKLRQLRVPVVMNSSKTVPEMCQLAEELGLADAPFVSENGSVIRWGPDREGATGKIQIIGAARDRILDALKELKQRYRFRSFADLGVVGVIAETQLSSERAEMALDRRGTEPLLWDDTEAKRLQFERELQSHSLTMTRGGRFWHVAGSTSKGEAMGVVADRLRATGNQTRKPIILAAIGDSPIDQSMLDRADVPIGIPTSSGLGVEIDPEHGIVATEHGAAGWAESVSRLLSRIDFTDSQSRNPLQA